LVNIGGRRRHRIVVVTSMEALMANIGLDVKEDEKA